MANQIHTELQTLAGANPAAYLSIDIFTTITISAVLASANKVKGTLIPVGQQKLSASLDTFGFTSSLGAAKFVPNSTGDKTKIALALNSNLVVTVKISVTGDQTKIVSIVTVTISNLQLSASYVNNEIVVQGVDFTPSTTIVRDHNADQILATAGIDPLEAARIEGLIAYSSVNNAVQTSLSQNKTISLATIFPAFDFGTNAILVPLVGGSALGIIPSSFTRVETAQCDCASGPDLGLSNSGNTITVPPNPTAGTQLGKVSVGGPLPEHIDPLKDLGNRFNGAGVAGVYLPQMAYKGLTIDVMPSITVHAQDNGFIGFDGRATVAFSNLQVSLDAHNGGIIVSVDMDISGQAYCDLDMGCGIRLPIGVAAIQPAPGSHASLQMGFYPSVDSSGNVRLKGVLNNVDMGQYVAVVIGVGTALKIIGVTAWIGFLVDVVLSALLAYEFPIQLRNEIKSLIGQNEWLIMNIGQLLNATYKPPPLRYAAPFDVDNNTLLASISVGKA